MSADQRADTAARRTTSFGSLIKRTKSNDILGDRTNPNSWLRRKSSEGERRLIVKDTPPALPNLEPQPVIESFGGENYIPDSKMSTRAVNGAQVMPRVPPLPDNVVDPQATTESMTHRSRYSYAHSTTSTVNSPRRMRRRKDPTPYK